MSWPPETTPSAAPGPENPSTPGVHPPLGQYPPAQYPPAGQNGAPGQYPAPDAYPAAGRNGAAGPYPPADHPPAGPGQYPPADYPPAGPGQYPAAGYPPAGPGQYPAAGYPPAGPGQDSSYGTGGLLAPGTFSAPPPAGPKVRLWPPSRPEWTTALGVILALVAAGAAIAPLWVQLAPRLAFRVDQPGRALPVVPEAEEYVAADGRFVFLTLALGVLAALGCWLVRRSRGPLVMVALAAGGLLGAVVTWRLGLRLGTGYQPEDLQVVGNVLHQPLNLRARAALVVEPTAAVIVYLLAVGFSARNDLGRDDPARDDPARDDPARDDLAHSGLGRSDPGRSDPGRSDPGRSDPGRDDPGRNDLGRSDLARSDLGRDDLARDDPGRDDRARNDLGRDDRRRDEGPVSSDSG